MAAQTCDTFELIVVDDGGTAPLEPLLAEVPDGLSVRLVRQENAGPASARNLGASLARGEVLAFTDDDCAPVDTWAQAMMDAVSARDQPVLIRGVTRNALTGNLFSQTSQEIVDFLAEDAGDALDFATSNNIAMPRAAFDELGGFDAAYPLAAGEDRAFCRDWVGRGWRITTHAEAAVDHHHDLDLTGFWRQNRNYGRGARVFHRSRDASPFRPFRRIGFYGRLVSYPLRKEPGSRAALRCALILVAQAAITSGYMRR